MAPASWNIGDVAVVKMLVTQSCPTLCDSMDYGQNTGVGSHSLLQRIFPTQGSNSGLPHCRRIPYQLSHKGSPRNVLDGLTEEMKFSYCPVGKVTKILFQVEMGKEGILGGKNDSSKDTDTERH